MSREQLEDFLHDFSKQKGLAELELNEDLTLELVINDNLSLLLQYNESNDNLNFISNIGYLSEKNSEQSSIKLLSANLFGLKTAGGFLALDEESSDVFYTYSFMLGSISYDVFYQKMNHFIEVAEHWQTLLSTMNI